jgi:hypothetical protein
MVLLKQNPTPQTIKMLHFRTLSMAGGIMYYYIQQH